MKSIANESTVLLSIRFLLAAMKHDTAVTFNVLLSAYDVV